MTRRLDAVPRTGAAPLAALHRLCFPEDPWDTAAMAEILSMPGAFGVFAQESQGPSGFVLALDLGGECEILSLGVLHERRRRGLGTALLDAVVGEARRRGAAALFLEVAADNRAARAFYAGHGFAEVGRRRQYYRRGTGFADAHRLYLPLTAAPSST